MTLILPIISLYCYFEYALFKSKKLRFEYKVSITLILVLLLELLLLRSSNLTLISFDINIASFIFKTQPFVIEKKLFVMYFFGWMALSKIFNNDLDIFPVRSLFSILFFVSMGLDGNFAYLFFIIGFFIMMDSSKLRYSKEYGMKYFLLILAILLAVVTDKNYSIYFPLSFVEHATKLEYFVIAFLALNSDKLLLSKDKGSPYSAVCVSVPFILYYISMTGKLYADESLHIFVFGLVTFAKIVSELIEFKGIKFILILKSLFPLFAIIFYEHVFTMLASYVFLVTFTQIYNNETRKFIRSAEEISIYVKSKWTTLLYLVLSFIFGYLLLNTLFGLNHYIAVLISILMIFVMKDFNSIYINYKATDNKPFITYLAIQMLLVNIYLVVIR